MLNMTAQNETFVSGFGERLREERKRLGLSQDEFAERVGIKRLAQLQYEKEVREPRTSYLAALGVLGVSLNYLLFGKRSSSESMTPDETRRIEKKIFDLIDEYVANQCGGVLSSEGRYVLFEVMRAQCVQAALMGRRAEDNLEAFLPKREPAG